jgi:hypothetical protein
MVTLVAVSSARSDASEQARNAKRRTPRAKDGRVSHPELDKTDLRKALVEIGEALRQMERLHSPENSGITRAEREIQRGDALARAQLGARFVDAVLARNDYTLVGV